MKQNFCTVLALSVFVFLVSCKKEAPVNAGSTGQVSEFKEPGKFKKELTLQDESGKNTVFLSLYSDDATAIDRYLQQNEVKLIIEQGDYIEKLKHSGSSASAARMASGNKTAGSNLEMPKNEANSVSLYVVSTNFENNVQGYSLLVRSKPNNHKGGGAVSPYNFVNSSNVYSSTPISFAGVVHLGGGYDIIAAIDYKNCSFLCGWKTGVAPYELLADPTITDPALYYEYSIQLALSCYQMHVGVWTDSRANGATWNYKIVFSVNDFTGRRCSSIGSYDGANCYVGTPPSGTTAFIWSNNFYYTPVNGNQCPMAGSSFDGANCYVRAVPSGCQPFIWSNNWYVKADRLPTP